MEGRKYAAGPKRYRSLLSTGILMNRILIEVRGRDWLPGDLGARVSGPGAPHSS
jgi:hypothetical protein